MFTFGLFLSAAPYIWKNENEKGMVLFYLIFGAGFILGLYLFIKCVRFRLEIKKCEITVFPLLSRKYTFLFEDIKTVERQFKKRYNGFAERVIIKTNQGKRIVIDSSFVAYSKLIGKIEEYVEPQKLITWTQT